jgi:osmotically-inducible protein OsmY
LLNDGRMAAYLMSVDSQYGIVTLKGIANNLWGKERAVLIAKHTEGVRAVIDQLDLRKSSRPDYRIISDVMELLAKEPSTKSYEPVVTSNGGVVLLQGTVASKAKKYVIGQLVEGVSGVRRVANLIEVQPRDLSDAELQAEIKQVLDLDPALDGNLIAVTVNRGRAELIGEVGSTAEKARANELAWVAGINNIESGALEVRELIPNLLRRPLPIVSDEQIARTLGDVVALDPRVGWMGPKAEVEKGVVILSGDVRDLNGKKSVEDDARNILGVKEVRSFLDTELSGDPIDRARTEAVINALRQDGDLNSLTVSVRSGNGFVYLDGFVSNDDEKERAELAAARVLGIRAIHNNLQVTNTPPFKTDLAIRNDVLARLASIQGLDPGNILIGVRDGLVMFEGAVPNSLQKRELNAVALNSGAAGVFNRVNVGCPLPEGAERC